MTLSPTVLKDALSPFFKPSGMPTGAVPDAVRQWVTAYAKYGKDAVAGGTLPAALVPVAGPPGTFFESLDVALRTMWMAVAWAAPPLVGTTLLVPPLSPILTPVASLLIKSRDAGQALSLITDALHTYTLSITVNVVPPTGSPVIAPLL